MAKSPIQQMAQRIVKQHPDHSARGLARKLQAATGNAITLEQARSRIRYHLGVRGKGTRRYATNKRAPRNAGEVRPMPKSMANPWTPHEMGVVGRIGIMSDVHVPYHSEIAVAAAVGYLADLGIDALLLNGDICDFYSISRWMKDPSQRDFKGELEACRDFLSYIRDRFPGIPIVLKAGNHEERWQHWLWEHAPEISDDPMMSLTAWLKLKDHDITLVEDQRPVMLGKLPVMHGHELPKGLAAPVNVARGAFLRTLTTTLVGHSHRTSNHTESNMWHQETACWSCGCLCDLTPEFSRINRWNWGFAVATVHNDRQFDVENLRITLEGVVRTS
jgi:predicted phosphodiesterase